MSTPPLIEIPSSYCIASVVMTLTRVVGLTSSPFTLEEQSFRWPGEQWSIDFVMPPMVRRDIASEWKAFGVKAEGRWGRFLLGDPSSKTPLGIATGSPLVDGNNQTGNTLITKGWSLNILGILMAGDYIQLGEGINARLYMVTENVNSDASGNASISISPSLRSSPIDNDIVITQNARGVFRMAENSFSWSVDPGPLYRMSFQAVEVNNA